MKVYVARSSGHKITKRWCMDMMIKWRRRIYERKAKV
jgi:hypothetical protein